MMNSSQYHQQVDEQWQAIQDGIDDSGADIDYELHGNVLTLEFADRSQIIINRQEPMQEIWLASKSGGFHFRYLDGQWLCSKTGIEFGALVRQECSKQAGEVVSW